MTLQNWFERTSWLWMILGGFYLLAYTYWYIPAFRELPGSISNPPAPYPWHWPLDVVATVVPGTVLMFFGFRRASELGGPHEIVIKGSDASEGDKSVTN